MTKDGDVPPAKTLGPELAARALEVLEQTVAEKEQAKEALEAKMADPDLYARPREFQETMEAVQKAQAELKSLYKRWETLAAEVEAMA